MRDLIITQIEMKEVGTTGNESDRDGGELIPIQPDVC
jgi:hypothetical protein